MTSALIPLTWLGTPKNFWPVALFAIIATSVACLLVVIKIAVDFDGVAKERKITTSSFFSGKFRSTTMFLKLRSLTY